MRQRSYARWPALCLAMVASGAFASAAAADRLAVPGSHLYYEVHGRGAPVVLIHGGNLDAGMWDGDVPVLAKTFRVITYDVRPFGRSGPVTDDYAWHEDLRALLDHLKIARADLVGLSLGARLAINFAIAYPSRVDRLVLAGPGLDGYAWTPDPLVAGLVAAVEARRRGEGDRLVARASLHGHGDARPEARCIAAPAGRAQSAHLASAGRTERGPRAAGGDAARGDHRADAGDRRDPGCP